MGRGEIHVQLYVNYADDEKLADVSRSARLLYVDGLCKSKALLTDGVLTRLQVEKMMYPERAAVAEKVAAELVASGAWTWDGRRRAYVITAFLKRNKSRAEVVRQQEMAAERSARGNHQKWHVAQGGFSADCRFCTEERSPMDPSKDPSKDPTKDPTRDSLSDPVVHSTETETETETEKVKPSRPTAARLADDDPDFDRFWAAYPRRVGKPAARKSWSRALKNGADPESVIEAAGRFTAQRGNEDPKFTPHPATWLNGERWNDEPDPAPQSAPGPVMPWELWD